MKVCFAAAVTLMLTTALSAQTGENDGVLLEGQSGDIEISIVDNSVAGEEFVAAFEAAQAGRQMLIDGQIAEGIAVLRPLADAGNAVAQNTVGVVLTEDVEPYTEFYDLEVGLAYLMASADQGFVIAIYNLGQFYQEEHGDISPNIEEAYRWHRAAADMDYAYAYYKVAYALANGEGVEQDIGAARIWAEAALEGPEPGKALAMLGDFAYYGEGEPVDFAKALDLFLQSTDAGDAYGAFSAGYMYYFGDGTEVDDPEAVRLFMLAREGGEARAYGYLAQAHREGYGVEVDFAAAMAFGEEGIESGDGFSMLEVAEMLMQGQGGEIDGPRARELAERARDLDYPEALGVLADLAYYGIGEPQDYTRAFTLFQEYREAAPQDSYAIYSVGYMLMYGEGTEMDVDRAKPLIEEALSLGSEYALIEIPVIYADPNFTGGNDDLARAWAGCLALNERGVELNSEYHDDTKAVCDTLEARLSAEQLQQAQAILPDFL